MFRDALGALMVPCLWISQGMIRVQGIKFQTSERDHASIMYA